MGRNKSRTVIAWIIAWAVWRGMSYLAVIAENITGRFDAIDFGIWYWPALLGMVIWTYMVNEECE